MQKEALLSAFAKSPSPSFRAREQLAREIGLPESRVRVWFQNRRSRSGMVRRGPESSASRSVLESPKPPEMSDARAQGRRSSPSGRRRPRTRLSSTQLAILLQAFERSPYPGIAAREELAQKTALPEDTIHIWFQNRRARQRAAGTGRVPSPDSLSSPEPNEAVDGSETERAQDSLLPLAAASPVGTGTLTMTCPSTSCRMSWPAETAQPSPPDVPETFTVARNTCAGQLFLDPVMKEMQDDQDLRHVQDSQERYNQWEQIQPTLEAPLYQAVYHALLEVL
ncbi:homeobox domain-containing protein [Pseudomonas sp. MAP12]|uniref:Homeobox domain-containing protein n=2 Tax=Geopseudomonas aromaticivorans TaxID=2849492 RepID=A0ABS6N067_9GAMM|nr:homeobox domain-containing protein [Pseudomonas aromaticivorans]